ncbi:unnamed protein product [Acanthoscelides obtectus]|uniref:Uncharacterized protein n=1 Tax=Acanthoscelides obtectus TaxID=200917 RepID=A0A9P0JQG1_ACAOB|nr:unnamed protein product [Acanthoscelides obtectus]CAK1657885.1 hypothetical protein AOBTE_LOCUS20582 [Acanthoscelides obtectus]
MNTRQQSKLKKPTSVKMNKANNSYIHLQADDFEDKTVTQEEILSDVRNKLASEQSKNNELSEFIVKLKEKTGKLSNELLNKEKTINHLKDLIEKLKSEPKILSECGMQTDTVDQKQAHTQTPEPPPYRKPACGNKPTDGSSSYTNSLIQCSIDLTDTSGLESEVECPTDEVLLEPCTEEPAALPSPAATNKNNPNDRRKILVFGDEYARNFRKVLELYIDKSRFTIESYVKPNIEFVMATKDIFTKTIPYGKDDFVIFMIKTQNINSSYCLNKGLCNLLPLGRTTNLIFLYELSSHADNNLINRINSKVTTYRKFNRNTSISLT